MMERTHAENSHQATENIRLLEVDFDKVGGFSLDVLDGLPNMRYLQIGRKRHVSVESFAVKAQVSLLGSAHAWKGNESTRSSCGARRTGVAEEGLSSAPSSASLGMACSAIRKKTGSLSIPMLS